jgi:hypothetical protein
MFLQSIVAWWRASKPEPSRRRSDNGEWRKR